MNGAAKRNRDDQRDWTFENIENGFNAAVTSVASAVGLVACLAFFPFLFGYFGTVHFGTAVLWVYAIANAVSFVAVAWDKARAQTHRWRISEAMLHLLEGFGGFAGSFLAQHLFLHKIRSALYQVTFWTIVLIHVGFWWWWSVHGAEWMDGMLEKHDIRRDPTVIGTPVISEEDQLHQESNGNRFSFNTQAFHWVSPQWPFWLPWTVLLPVPFVAFAYERIWVRRFSRRQQHQLAGRSSPAEPEIADWRRMYRWRYVVRLVTFLGKPVVVLFLLAIAPAACALGLWIWKLGDYSPVSVVLGILVILVVIPLGKLFYDAACEQLENLELGRLMAAGREDVSRMMGVQVRMDDATRIAENYVRAEPSKHIYQVWEVICTSSTMVLGTSALVHVFGIVDLAWLIGNWGIPAAFLLYALMSIFSYLDICRDKKAENDPQKRRVPNAELHALEMLGGFVGSFLAQHLHRHKINNFAYQYVFWSIVAFHMIAWVVLLGALEPVSLTRT
ncbi:MAG: DUF1294 domain-containing protein [Pirellulales bacterium]|nr:DUF1294 domain-containing protein [Pirellulales bacterium]